VTYSDMITLVLVFFILLFSMSQIDQLKFESVTESFQSRTILDFLPSSVSSDHPGGDGILDMDEPKEDDEDARDADEIENETALHGLKDQLDKWEEKADALAALMENVEDFLIEEDLEEVVSANRTEEGVVLVLQDSILFDSAEAKILQS